jgi:putative nucleotidyltransferase with HDIG domain
MTDQSKLERYFEVIAEVSRTLHESEDLTETLQVMVEKIAQAVEAKGCLLRMLDSSGRELELMAATGLSQAYLDKGMVLADVGLSEVFEDGVVIIEDVTRDPRIQYPEAAVREGVASVIGIPLRIMGSMRMVLRIYFDRRLQLDTQEQRFLYSLAQQTAVAIKNSLLQTRYLETFRKVSAAIHDGDEVGDILEGIVTTIRDIMEARGCIYWIVDTARQNVHMKVTSGFQMENLSGIGYEILEDVFHFHEDRETIIRDIRDDPRIPSTSRLGKQLVTSILGIPFAIVGEYTGILAVYFSRERELLPSEISFVRASGRQGAIALHKAFRYDERMFKAFQETIEGLVLALEAKDVCTHGHSLNVANYSLLIARQMGLSEKEADTVYHAGLLHDIGKIAMQDQILDNLGNLSPEDFETIKQHPVIGARIIRPLSFLGQVVPLIHSHHERFDGSGYPEGLAGEEIPLGARILAVSDSFDAMTSDRPGTTRMSVNKAMNILQEQSGTRFDPDVVRAFVRVVEADAQAVQPFNLPKDGSSGRLSELKKEAAKRKSPLASWLRKCTPGF